MSLSRSSYPDGAIANLDGRYVQPPRRIRKRPASTSLFAIAYFQFSPFNKMQNSASNSVVTNKNNMILRGPSWRAGGRNNLFTTVDEEELILKDSIKENNNSAGSIINSRFSSLGSSLRVTWYGR